jgi:hypothetical protein
MVARMFEAVAEAGLYVRVAVPLGTFKLARISPMGYLQATNKGSVTTEFTYMSAGAQERMMKGVAYFSVWKLT